MFFKYFIWIIVVVSVLFFYVWQQTQSTRLGYQVEQVRKECEKWEQKNRVWRLRVNSLLSLERLDQISKESMLKTPNEKSIIYLDDDKGSSK